eukprot:10246870-Alexandrium_andersonii.AAC.1
MKGQNNPREPGEEGGQVCSGVPRRFPAHTRPRDKTPQHASKRLDARESAWRRPRPPEISMAWPALGGGPDRGLCWPSWGPPGPEHGS